MKKLVGGRDEWLQRRGLLIDRRVRRRAAVERHTFNRRGVHGGPSWRTAVIEVPQTVTADTTAERGKLLKTLNSMVKAIMQPRVRIKLDFTRTVRMFPGGMLLLLAYLEMMVEEHPGRIVAKCSPGSVAAQLLHQFGFSDKLRVNASTSVPKHESVLGWRYLTGTVADGASIAALIDSYRQETAAKIPEGLYEVLTEALTNVRHHAYPEGSEVPQGLQRWWLFARYVEPKKGKPGNLFVGVYDIGVGIQRSMRKRLKPGEVLVDQAGRILDLTGISHTRLIERLLIEAAVDGPRSSTGLSFRGHGLPEMRNFVMGTTSGRLSIISGWAQYSCLAATQQSGAHVCAEPVLGTLIVWSMPLQPAEGQL